MKIVRAAKNTLEFGPGQCRALSAGQRSVADAARLCKRAALGHLESKESKVLKDDRSSAFIPRPRCPEMMPRQARTVAAFRLSEAAKPVSSRPCPWNPWR